MNNKQNTLTRGCSKMKMTPEEAIERIKDHMEVHSMGQYPHMKLKEALEAAISSLRSISHKQVEKVWKGEWIMHDDELGLTCECSRCHIETMGNTPFCPHCGAPMTDEAMNMVMERMKAINNA